MSEVTRKRTVQIYTDGACSGNPGPGGWGCILNYNGKTKESQRKTADRKLLTRKTSVDKIETVIEKPITTSISVFCGKVKKYSQFPAVKM